MVQELATFNQILNHTTNSYKFYWWLAIINLVKKKSATRFSFNEIVFNIITQIWYPVNYFKLSFGKQDKLSDFVLDLKQHYQLEDGIGKESLETFLIANQSDTYIKSLVKKITRYVPYRFIRPWFADQTIGMKDQEVETFIKTNQWFKIDDLPYTIKNRVVNIHPQTTSWVNGYFGLNSATYFGVFVPVISV